MHARVCLGLGANSARARQIERASIACIGAVSSIAACVRACMCIYLSIQYPAALAACHGLLSHTVSPGLVTAPPVMIKAAAAAAAAAGSSIDDLTVFISSFVFSPCVRTPGGVRTVAADDGGPAGLPRRRRRRASEPLGHVMAVWEDKGLLDGLVSASMHVHASMHGSGAARSMRLLVASSSFYRSTGSEHHMASADRSVCKCKTLLVLAASGSELLARYIGV